MKVLIFNVNSHEGSTGMIAYNLLNYLRGNGHNAKLLSGNAREKKLSDPDILYLNNHIDYYFSIILTRLLGYEGKYNWRANRKAIQVINNFKPDVVQLYGMHAYWIDSLGLLEYLKINKIPTVYSMMDESPYLGKCPYAYDCLKFQTDCKDCPKWKDYPATWFFNRVSELFHRKKEIYNGFENIVFTGPQWVINRAKTAALMKGQRLELLNEPINYSKSFFPHDATELRKKLGIPKDNKVVLSVTVMNNTRKGGQYFLRVAEKLMKRKDISFVFVGYNVDCPAPRNVITIPILKSQDLLATYMSMADILVCTSLADTMPNVCLDALGCGTPLCGFAEKGVPFCAPKPLGIFTKTYDIEALAETIETCPRKTKELSEACIKHAHKNFSTISVFGRLVEIYNEIKQ